MLKQGTLVLIKGKKIALPMLPERLSSELYSLKPQEDRLILGMEMTIDQLGRERGAHFYKEYFLARERWKRNI